MLNDDWRIPGTLYSLLLLTHSFDVNPTVGSYSPMQWKLDGITPYETTYLVACGIACSLLALTPFIFREPNKSSHQSQSVSKKNEYQSSSIKRTMIFIDNYLNTTQQKSKNVAFTRDTIISGMQTKCSEDSMESTGYSFTRNLGTSEESHRSSSIPLPASHVHRTSSELQLRLDQEVAEARDLNMFYLMVNGIREKQRSKDPDINEFIQARMRAIHCSQGQQAQVTPVLNIPSIVKVHATPTDEDDWSVTGYVARINASPEEDDGVFEMEL